MISFRYVTGPLVCGVTYIIKLSARNKVGESNMSRSHFKTVCSEQSQVHCKIGLHNSNPYFQGSNSMPPIILFAMDNILYSKDITLSGNLWSSPTKLAEMNHQILDLDFHHQHGVLYILCDSFLYTANISQQIDGAVNISQPEKNENHLKLQENGVIESISVDWLNDAVYFSVKSSSVSVSELGDSQDVTQQGQETITNYWAFVYCDLTLANCNQLGLNIDSKPRYLKSDPYHGHIYWIQNYRGKDVLYKSALKSSSSCGPIKKEKLYSATRLSQFVVSYLKYSIFVPDLDRNLMLQVSLDTQEVTPVHTQLSESSTVGWKDVVSLIQFQQEFDRFYWSSDSGFNIEFYNNKTGFTYSQINTEIK